MKKIIYTAILSVALFSCKNEIESQYKIIGKADGLKNGQIIFLEKEDEMQLTAIDTAVIKNGEFTFKGTQTEPELHFIHIKDLESSKVPVILEEGTISITIYKDSLDKSRITGTYNNDELYSFRTKGNTRIKAEMKAFERNNNAKMVAAQQSKDVTTINQLQKTYQAFLDRIEKYNNDYINKNPTSYVSVLLLEDMMYNPTSNIQTLKKQYNKLSAELKNTKKGKSISEAFEKLSIVDVGVKAPDFEAPNPQGKIVSLKESMGKLTLVEFWASWCGPCRQENPYIVKMYNEFHDKGFNIISISLDKNQDDWVEAIAEDNLRWNHISHLKSWQEPIAILYSVKSIPSTFLLDQNGIVIAKDLRQEDLHKKIKELLK